MLMPLWAWSAATYAAILAIAALTQPIKRQAVAIPATAAYGVSAIALGMAGPILWVALVAPGLLLLFGYWLSGFFFRDPQSWLEAWLLHVDRSVNAERWMARLPRLAREFLELSYTSVYAVIGGSAVYAATVSLDAVTGYWNLVLAAGLASYAPLPWLRSRPPRALEDGVLTTRSSQKPPNSTRSQRSEGAYHPHSAVSANETLVRRSEGAYPLSPAVSAPVLRRLNTFILDAASVQANTLPSGHVAGAVSAALAVSSFDPVIGAGLMVMAGVIAVAAIAGRYHYVVDCVAGAMVAFAFSSLM
jgi:hypothetical protein